MTREFRYTLVSLSLALSPAALSATDAGLLKMIQLELERIGYDLETADGVLDKSTIVAITKFQASKGLEVTGQPSPQLAGILQAEQAGASSNIKPARAASSTDSAGVSTSNGLSIGYLAGHWCTDSVQEKSLYNFAADGSYRLGVLGLTISQFNGVNYFPDTRTRQSFLDTLTSIDSIDQNRFTVTLTNGKKEIFTRGNCFE